MVDLTRQLQVFTHFFRQAYTIKQLLHIYFRLFICLFDILNDPSTLFSLLVPIFEKNYFYYFLFLCYFSRLDKRLFYKFNSKDANATMTERGQRDCRPLLHCSCDIH